VKQERKNWELEMKINLTGFLQVPEPFVEGQPLRILKRMKCEMNFEEIEVGIKPGRVIR
jgi:hypothetical protein